VSLSLGGVWRRQAVPEPFLPIPLGALHNPLHGLLKGRSRADQVLIIALAVAIVAASSSLIYIIAVPEEESHFTEFYVLGEDGKTLNYQINTTIGKNNTVILGIANHEGRDVSYSIEVWMVKTVDRVNVSRLWFIDSFYVNLSSVPALQNGTWVKQWEDVYTFSLPYNGTYKVWFNLVKDGVPFQGEKGKEYSSPEYIERFVTLTKAQDSLNLNLNVKVTKA